MSESWSNSTAPAGNSPTAPSSTQGPAAAAGLTVGSLAWLVTGALGLRAARRRQFAEHARWMTYNAALTFAAVTFRTWLPLLVVVQLPLLGVLYGGRFESAFWVAYALTCWLAFLPNVGVVELVRRRRSAAGPAL